MRDIPLAKTDVKVDQFPLKGGLDLHSPQTSLPPGYARSATNFECAVNGGYTRIPGYERSDGRPSPTAAVYNTLSVSSVTGLAVGDAVNGQTSGATAVVAAIDITSQSPLKLLVITKVVGTFVAAENLRKVTTVIGTITTVGVTVTNQTSIATYQLAAANIYRADITVVPGSGAIRGIWVYNGLVYAVRDNAGGTAGALYRQSGSGWVLVPFLYEVAFQTGSVSPSINLTITKGAVSATVRRVILESGSWSGGDAKGRFLVEAPTGGTFTAGALTAGGTASLWAGLPPSLVVQQQVSWLPGGRVETDQGNAGNGVKLYGADSVNRGFEFDGTYIVPINTGVSSDVPTHVKVHKKYLVFSFASAAMFAGVGTPFTWTAVGGAVEIDVDDTITSFLTLPGTTDSAALAIIYNRGISILYGTGSTGSGAWNLVPLNAAGVGGKSYCSRTLSEGYVYGDNGIVAINAVKEFGNFSPSTLTARVKDFVKVRRTLATEALINREKSQYRVFFSDGYALYISVINGKFLGAMPILYPNPVSVACNGPSANGNEVSYFGSTNGMVYQMDTGASFDGAVIDYHLDLAFNSQGNSRILKRYRKAVFEMQGDHYAEFSVGWTLAYGAQDVVSTTLGAKVNGVYWDSFTWDQFVWDGIAIAPAEISIEGSAENVSISVTGSSALWSAFTINSVTLQYTPRRLMR